MSDQLKNQKRQFWVILLIVFLGFVGISIPYLIFPPLFLNDGYAFLPQHWNLSFRALFLGITLAVYPLGQFIGSPILGSLSDEYGRKHLLSGTLIIAGIFNFLTGVAIAKQQLSLLVISRFIAGLMEGNIAIARAMCADLKLLSKHKTFGKINAATSIAYLIGPFLGGVLTDKDLFEELTLSSPFFLICILFFSLAILSALLLKPSTISSRIQRKNLWERFNFISRMLALFSNKHLKILMITSTCFTLAVDIFYEFGPVYLTVKWMLKPEQLIFYNGVLCIGLAIGNGWLPSFVSSRISRLLSILISIGGFALFMTLAVLTNSFAFMLTVFAFAGLVIGLAVTLLTVKISDSVSDNLQGEVMGIQVSLRVLGDAIICLLGATLLILSAKIILIVSSILSLTSMIYYALRGKNELKI